MIKHPPFTESLVNKLSALVPQLRIDLATSILVRGITAKGRYETRIWDEGRELRTSFSPRGENELTDRVLLLKTPLSDSEDSLQEHAIAIRENEQQLPWIERLRDPQHGDEHVFVKPFGADENAPMVTVRRSARTGAISLEVKNGREMSPAEANLVAQALLKAARLAAADTAGSSAATASE